MSEFMRQLIVSFEDQWPVCVETSAPSLRECMTEVLEEFGIEQTRPREYALVFRHSNGQDLALSQSKFKKLGEEATPVKLIKQSAATARPAGLKAAPGWPYPHEGTRHSTPPVYSSSSRQGQRSLEAPPAPDSSVMDDVSFADHSTVASIPERPSESTYSIGAAHRFNSTEVDMESLDASPHPASAPSIVKSEPASPGQLRSAVSPSTSHVASQMPTQKHPQSHPQANFSALSQSNGLHSQVRSSTSTSSTLASTSAQPAPPDAVAPYPAKQSQQQPPPTTTMTSRPLITPPIPDANALAMARQSPRSVPVPSQVLRPRKSPTPTSQQPSQPHSTASLHNGVAQPVAAESLKPQTPKFAPIGAEMLPEYAKQRLKSLEEPTKLFLWFQLAFEYSPDTLTAQKDVWLIYRKHMMGVTNLAYNAVQILTLIVLAFPEAQHREIDQHNGSSKMFAIQNIKPRVAIPNQFQMDDLETVATSTAAQHMPR